MGDVRTPNQGEERTFQSMQMGDERTHFFHILRSKNN